MKPKYCPNALRDYIFYVYQLHSSNSCSRIGWQ